ncbi:MAG: DUF1704 domain-containing protein, partial [Deltaproteobacteria bacterium]|nr:DUF1704 domain-containing protein [Deltaproteobacteria bacterium]
SQPLGGQLYIERPLPFICLYRQPHAERDLGTRRLVTGEAAFLIASTHTNQQRSLRALLEAIATPMIQRFGAYLVLEIWAGPPASDEAGGEPPGPSPRFALVPPSRKDLVPTVETLSRYLGRVRILKRGATVVTSGEQLRARPPRPAIFPRVPGPQSPLQYLGMEVRPIYRNGSGELFPLVLRNLRRQVSVAIRRTFHRFTATFSREVPLDYKALGQRRLVRSLRRIDDQLAAVASQFDLVLEVTPANVDEAWAEFRRSRFERAPTFYYRPLPVDPIAVKRRLFAISTDRIEEPTLAELFRENQLNIDRELSALLDRGTSRFLHQSLTVFGTVSDDLWDSAQELVRRLPARERGGGGGPSVSAAELAARAQQEVDRYRERYAGFTSTVQVRDDIFAGLLVSRGNLFIGSHMAVPENRADALIQHEIGTHALTYHNGLAQPFKQLALGLPGYDELQEGLAVIAEYLVGGLSKARLRLLGGRVIAARLLLDGATFIDTFRVLNHDSRFDQRTAFTIATRVYRGGGLTKDAAYLRGLIYLTRYLRKGGAIEPLLVGKVGPRHVRIVEELLARQVLRPPMVRPLYLDRPEVGARLARLREATSLLELVKGRTS